MHLNRRLSIALLTGLLVTTLTGPVRPDVPASPASTAAPENPPAPNLPFTALEGRQIRLAEFTGKVVLLDFWATWCGPCRQALPSLKKLRERLRQEPFALISIGCDLKEDKLKDFVRGNQMDWVQVWDDGGDVQRAYHIRGLPTYVVVDATGKVVYSVAGWSPEIESHLRAEVEKAVASARAGSAGRSVLRNRNR